MSVSLFFEDKNLKTSSKCQIVLHYRLLLKDLKVHYSLLFLPREDKITPIKNNIITITAEAMANVIENLLFTIGWTIANIIKAIVH
ncbi:hypothetical protein [Hydrogenivirga sp. 128-5-R1-1]|uniref:hypothetical protein n=1 Tax=Hydrogenivirga sp. 128-5-R1-1 TaxID=392423 RepID=UPI0012FA063F|nr:hypothetical protein [Hydrogenivirga sp. 128-5-R1-1]